MKVLIVKMSSMGDVIHMLPALTDAGKAIPGIHFDWVVEEGFAEIPRWHPLVDRVIPIALRRWRKNWFRSLFSKEVRQFIKTLRREKYDLIIDAQGLIKSAVVTRLARGLRVGLNKRSLTEPLARFAYQKTVDVDLQRHAICRMRSIVAQALGYEIPKEQPDSNLSLEISSDLSQEKNIVFLHATTWATKHWIDEYWVELANLLKSTGYKVHVPWASESEYLRAKHMADHCDAVEVLPKMSLKEVAGVLKNATGIVSVDTGLSHLAAALKVPTVVLYGPTSPKRIGTIGESQVHLSAPKSHQPCDKDVCRQVKTQKNKGRCLAQLKPQVVFEALMNLLGGVEG